MSIKIVPLKKKTSLKSQAKQELQNAAHLKNPVPFFLNPLPCHRIYRDYIIPHYTFNSNDPIYLFLGYLDHKTISQVHIREKGLIYQFNDKNPEFVTPLGLLRTRLNSLGNQFAHDLAEFLPAYYSYFQASVSEKSSYMNYSNDKGSNSFFLKNSKKESKFPKNIYEPLLPTSSLTAKILILIDHFLNQNEDNATKVSVSQVMKGGDDRLVMFGFNKKCLSLIFLDEDNIANVFEEEFIENCLKIFYTYNYEARIKELSNFLLFEPLRRGSQTKEFRYMREINTVLGVIKADLSFLTINVEIDNSQFCFNVSAINNKMNSWMDPLILNKKKIFDQKSLEILSRKKEKNHSDWEKLLKFYYPRILEEKKAKNLKKNMIKNVQNEENVQICENVQNVQSCEICE